MRNTKSTGNLNFFTYFDKSDDVFVGVCIELGIIKTNSDESQLKTDLIDAAKGYVETVCTNKLSTNLLNQEPPEKYMQIYQSFLGSLVAKRPVRPTSRVDLSSAAVFARPVICPTV